MRRLKLYLETSVWNFYFADDAPEKRDITRQFFEQIQRGEQDIFISEIVFREIARASAEKQTLLLELIAKYQPKELEMSEESVQLATTYIQEIALPERAIEGARHVAIATVHEMDALIRWNLKHIANLNAWKE